MKTIKLNEKVYNKLLLQAQEAKEQKMIKLADGILNSIGPTPEDENVEYSFESLNNDTYDGLWKLAMNVIKYYNVESANAEKIDEALELLASKFIDNLKESLGMEQVLFSSLEPKVPGENK